MSDSNESQGFFGNLTRSIAGGAGNIVSGILNNISNARQNKITRQREDTAVQRRTADMKAAGINPLLAAGDAAQTSTPISMQAPEVDITSREWDSATANIARNNADIARTTAETNRINLLMAAEYQELLSRAGLHQAGIKESPYRIREMETSANLKGEQTRGQEIKNKVDQRDWDLIQRRPNVKSNDNWIMQGLGAGTDMITSFPEKVKEDNFFDWVGKGGLIPNGGSGIMLPILEELGKKLIDGVKQDPVKQAEIDAKRAAAIEAARAAREERAADPGVMYAK